MMAARCSESPLDNEESKHRGVAPSSEVGPRQATRVQSRLIAHLTEVFPPLGSGSRQRLASGSTSARVQGDQVHVFFR